MAAVHSKDTSAELAVRKMLCGLGHRYRLHGKALPGRPDVVFSALRKVIFVHGCFWHRHRKCRYATLPKTRPDYWEAKFISNMERDRRACRELKRMKWMVLTVWQCELKQPDKLAERLDEFLSN
jgi:DNA mismatch endonuclease (patch repair protein)